MPPRDGVEIVGVTTTGVDGPVSGLSIVTGSDVRRSLNARGPLLASPVWSMRGKCPWLVAES